MTALPANEAATVQTGGGPRNLDDLIATVSASRLSTFHQCRLRFCFRYVLGLARPKSRALHVGSSVHAVLKFWNKARWKSEQPSLKQLHDVYAQAWGDEQEKAPVQWDGEEDEQKKTGWRLLETYFRDPRSSRMKSRKRWRSRSKRISPAMGCQNRPKFYRTALP